MKVSLNWLKQYVDVKLSAAEIANRLTLAGIEVKSSQVIGENWESIVIAEVLSVNKHPNADRLSLVTVNQGSSEETVVCGAPNVVVGAKVAYAPVGTKLLDPYKNEMAVLKPAKIRGVESRGMCCSEKELGISDSHEGILIMPSDTPIGTPLTDYYGDVIYNLEVTPNRPDCLSIIGLAREVAALTGTPLKLPDTGYPESNMPVTDKVSVEIQDAELCPRYCAGLITGIKIAESPKWMQERLLSYGMHPINNIVDIANFVMLEYGQPLHTFDYEKVAGGSIIVRRAENGEKFISLDSEERTLTRNMLMIADKERTVAIAGIMGGENSEVTENTTSILLESASFKPASIHYTGHALGMGSEACIRFERGISPEITVEALKRATQLLVELGGGEAAKGIIDVYPGKIQRKPVKISTADMKRCIGMEYSVEQIVSSLTALGFDCKANEETSSVLATAPYWRTDINILEDVIEEVARMQGYDQIPTTLLAQPIPRQSANPVTAFKRRVRNMMAGYGFQEIATFSMTNLEVLSKLSPKIKRPDPMPVHIANPATSEQEYLRPTLRGGLLSALNLNKSFIDEGLRLFELGKVYINKDGDLPDEIDTLCAVICGRRLEHWWQEESAPVDFFDIKGIAEGLLRQISVSASFSKSSDEALHPVKQASIMAEGKQIGIIGELHPAIKEHFEIPGNVCLLEMDLPLLLPLVKGKSYKPVARFPSTARDLALVTDVNVTHQQVLDIVKEFKLVTKVELFDVYVGEQVPAGKKSMAYRLTFQTPEKTLNDKQVSGVQQAILKKLASELGASLRK